MPTLENIKAKILSGDILEHQLNRWRFFKKKIVFTNGCFDLLHAGHIDYLSKAADMGDALVIGLNSDESVKRLKGKNRPINDQEQRSLILASLGFVSAVVLFDEDTPYNLISKIKPQVLVKGGDYKPEQIAGADVVLANGGEVRIIDLLPGYSTTDIEKRILNAGNS
ncbi:MAG TPA: D-glycero-beta-D-manno-heptose 1-phosphate adenylyltransferase [Bacteroidia bacterium]|nr:D-glycero-beta-D-manno-heptose 1-phosphate adenylyltransferase [Bacteroidia bacterium]